MKIKLPLCVLILCFLLAGCEVKPHVQWTIYTPEALLKAANSGQPSIVYFYAAWCGVCYQLKDKTFTDPQIIQALASYARFKVDMSFTHASSVRAAGRRFEIGGVPTTIIFDSHGKEVMRFEGFFTPDQLLNDISEQSN
jgi:thiol:disulfide interchange protein DsbD